jgi:WD40 repeat protein
MIECPELGALEANPLPPELRDHISGCTSCKLVLEVVGDVRLELDDCIRFDALLAARADGTLGRAGKNLLERHLASCASCREVAETLSPTQDADGDQENLPQVDPASYALGLEVARGGMGRVIAARDLRIGRPIAIKELLGRSPQLAARFEREARVTARLQHPGIVPIYEIGKWPDGTPFYSMRMVDGRMLAEAITSAKTLPARLALLPAVIAATEAVAFAHAKRVIHRDLTPSNILVGAYGETVVIDWGLAKDLADGSVDDELDEVESSSERLTGVGAVIGTATYMPPEQAHAIPVDERADVYALGAILYHVLAGAPPYRAKTAKELLRAVKTAPPPPIERVQPGTPRDLVSIITKAMARDPDARYPSARELAEELKRFQTGRLVEAHVYSRFELFKRFLARHRAAVTVSLLALAISLSFGTIAVRKILRSNHEARETVRELILEKGRIELLAGNTQRALAYLWNVYQTGDDSPTLQFLLGSALRGLSTSEHTLDCGTNGTARSLAFDRSATFVAAGCHEVTKVWRIADGKEVASFETGDEGYDGVKFSPDGTRLATWGESGIARVWDLATGALVAKLDHSAKSEINRAAFSPDAALLATTGADGFAIIWDVRTQAVVHRIQGSTKPGGLGSLYGGMSPDGKRLYTVSPDGIGKGWDVATGTFLGQIEHGDLTIGGDLSPIGDLAVSCGQDGRVRIWDVVGDRGLIHQFEGHTAPVWKCVFSQNGKLVVSGGHDGRANVYDLETAKLLTTVDHGDIVINADVSPDQQRFATTGLAGRVRLWDTRTGALIANLDSVKGKDARFADSEHLVAARGDGRIQIFRLEPPAHLDGVPGDAEIGATSTQLVHTDGALANNVLIRELGKRASTPTGLTAPFAVAKDAPVVAGGAGVRRIRVIDIAGKQPPRDIAVEDDIRRVALSADGARLAVIFVTAEPQIWDVASQAKLLTLAGAREATLSEDGRIAAGWQQTELRIWDVDAHKASVTIPVATAFSIIGFARMGTRIAIREGLGVIAQVKLWNTQTGKLVATHADTGSVTTFDPSRAWLTTIDADHSVNVWSTEDGSVRASFLGEKLMQVQANAKATFVAGIAEYGGVALLMSAADGRILARWPLEHSAPIISSTGFDPPTDGSVMWTHDGSAVMTRSAKVSMWPVANGYGPKQMAQLVNRNVSWRVENGQLAWIRNAKLHGTVTRAGAPQANVEVVVEIRTPADIGAAPISWESSKKRVSTRKLVTNALGQFSTENLLPGEYTLTIGTRTITAYVSAEDEPIEIELAP